MPHDPLPDLSRRERQIMDVVFMLGEAAAADILERMPEPVSDASLRKLVRVLEAKGHLTHRREGRSHVYRPTVPAEVARRQAAGHLLSTHFRGSVPRAFSALLDASARKLSDDDLAELRRLIEDAEDEGR